MLSFSPVGLDDYVTYFRRKFKNFIYFRWRFPHSSNGASGKLIHYENEDEISVKNLDNLPIVKNRILYFATLPFHYFFYLLQALWYLRRRSNDKSYRVLMGVNYYCTFCGLLLKKLGAIDAVIYRVMDFFPLPPSGPYRFFNWLFYKFDRFCLTHSDEVWFTTEGHIIGREKYGYFDRNERRYRLIPLGVNASEYVDLPLSIKGKHSLVYCGVVSSYHMLDVLFDLVDRLRYNFSDIRLNIIGDGPDLPRYKALCNALMLSDRVIFHGFLEEGEKFRRIMCDNALGIAFYRDEENFMKYTEPAKVKYYLNFGVPALVSKVPRIAVELETQGVAIAVSNDIEIIVKQVSEFLRDQTVQDKYRYRISEYVKEIDIFHMLDDLVNRFIIEANIM